MEWANESVSSSFYSTVLTSLQRYYVFMRLKMHRFSARTVILLSLLQTLQFVSFIFPSEENRGLPWNYKVLKPLWTLISLMFDPLKLLEWSGAHSAIMPGIALGLLLEQVLTSLVLMVLFTRLSHYDYITELGAPRVGIIHFWHFRLHEASNFLLLKVLYFPVVFHFAADCTCLSAYTCMNPPNLPPSYVLYIELPALTLLAVRKLADVAFVGNIQWQTNDFESLSACLSRAVLIWLETVMVCTVSALSYRSHPALYGFLLLTLGFLFLNYLYRRMPFHSVRMNQMKIIKGQLFLWTGITTLITEGMGGYSQGSFGPTLLYWLSILVVLPMLVGFYATRVQVLAAVKRPDQAFEIEHMIRAAIANEQLQVKLDNVLRVALQMFPQSVDLTLWTIYYYVLLKDTIFVKVSLAKLMGMRIGVVSLVESFYAVFFVENWLRATPTEREPLDYMHKRARLSQIRKHDQEICERLYETFSSIGQVSMRFETVVTNFHRIIKDIELCKHNYALTAKIHQSKDVLDSYASFLDLLQQDEKALSLRYMSSETVKEQVKRRDGKVSLFDSNIMIVMMSLAMQNFGYVTSATGSELLGYMDEQVIGSHHSVLIPPPFNENHDAMLRRITKFRHKHPVYESHHVLYFLDRARFLVSADWKVCLINHPESGELAVLAAIRPHANFDEVAFVDNSQKHVTVMVFSIQTRGFSQFLVTFSIPPADAATAFRLSGVSDWSGSESVFSQKDVTTRQESGTMYRVMADTLMVFGLRKQILLRLKAERASSLQQSSLPVPSKRLMWGSEFSARTLTSTVPMRSEAQSRSSSTFSRSSIYSVHREKMRRVERLTVWVKVTIGVGLLMLVATVAAFVGFCRAEVEAVEDLFELVGHFQNAEIWTLKAGVVARDLALGGRWEESAVRLRAEEVGAVLKDLSEEARSRLAAKQALWDIAGINDNIWWEYEQHSFIPRRKNLIDTLDSLSSLCYILSKPGISLAPLLTLARNANAETFAYEHEIYHHLLSSGKDAIESTGPIVVLLLCLSEAAVLAVVCMLATAVCCIEQFRRSVWTFLLAMPALIVSLSRSMVQGRLSLDFGQELSEQSSYKEKEIRLSYVRSKYEKALYCVLVAALVGSISFLLVTALTFTADLSSLEEELMDVEEINIVRITSKLQALIYMKETVLRTRLDPLLDRLATVDPVANSSEYWERALETGYIAERDFCSLSYLSSTAFNSNFLSLESALNTLHLGLHSAADELIMRQRHLRALQALSPLQTEAESFAIDGLYYAMEPALLTTMQSVSTAQRDTKATRYTAAITALAGFAGIVLVLWVAVLYPLLHAVLITQFAQFLKKEWSIVLLFQDDEQGTLATRLKNFNSRPVANG